MRKKMNVLLVFAILFSHMALVSPAMVHAEEYGVAEASVGDFVVDTAKEAYKRIDEVLGDFAYDVLGIGRDPRNNPRQRDKSRSLGRVIWDQLVDRSNWAEEIFSEAVMNRYDVEDILDFMFPIWRTPEAGDESVDVITGAAPAFVDMRVSDDFIFAIGESITAYNNEEWRFVDESFTYIGTINGIPNVNGKYLSGSKDNRLSFIFPIKEMNPDYRIQFRAESKHPFHTRGYSQYGLSFVALYENDSGSIVNNANKAWRPKDELPYTDDYAPEPGKYVHYFEERFGDYRDNVFLMTNVMIQDNSDDPPEDHVVSISYRVVDESGLPVSSGYGVEEDNPFEEYTGMTVDDIYNELRERFDADEPIRHYIGDEEDRENVVPIYNDDGSAGPGFFGNLIAGVVDVLGKLLEAVLGLASTLLNVLIDAFTAVIGLIIPNAEQIAGFGESFASIRDAFTDKFSFIFDIADGFKNIFSPPAGARSIDENIFTKEWTILGQSFVIVHPMLYPVIENVRTVLSSMLVVFTFVNIYKRIVGSGDVIK